MKSIFLFPDFHSRSVVELERMCRLRDWGCLVGGLMLLQQPVMTNASVVARPVYKKYIVVTGGVISGIGKGITASSMGVLLKMLNVRPTAIKIDPYLNVDAGTMSPFEHGGVMLPYPSCPTTARNV